jgi:hypothetical protein
MHAALAEVTDPQAEPGPAGLAPGPGGGRAGEPGWVRARWRVQRLDWVPSVLAGLDRPFVIEEPDELRERVRALAEQLATYAEAR